MRCAAAPLCLAPILVLAASAADAQLTVDADTVALWHLDEGTGTTAADSGALGYGLAFLRSPSDGSAGSTLPTWQDEGCIGAAVDFAKGDSNGSGGYLYRNQAHAFAQDELSVELLLRTSAPNAILFYAGFIQLHLGLELNGRVRMQVGDGNDFGPAAISDVAVDDGAWHYVAGTYDGANVRIFVDGVQAGVSDYAGTVGTVTGLFVGGRPSNTFFGGTIDEVRLSDAARGGPEIAATWAQLAVFCPEPEGGVAAAVAGVAILAVGRRRP